MKKFICILAVIAIMLSSVTAVFADAAPASVGLGEVKELLATDYRHVYARPSIGIYTGANGGVTGTTYGGGMYFRFTAPQACEAKLTVKWLPNTSSSWSDFLAFLNPCGAPEAFTCTSAMVEGTDYPAKSEAVIDYKFVQSDLTARAAAEGSSNPTYCEKEVVVNLIAGENLFWIPARTLKSMDNDGNAAENAVEPYNQANAQLLVHSLTVEIPETGEFIPDTVTVYVKDLAKSNLSTSGMSKTINGLNKSYVNVKEPDNEYGYTNYANGGEDWVKFPFNVAKNGKYKLKVYYAIPATVPASLHLDDATDVIANGDWLATGYSTFIDNGGASAQADTELQAHTKAPYFAIKTFDLGNLETGAHSVKFAQEKVNSIWNNTRLLINRIEIIPETAAKKVEINSYAVCYANYAYLSYVDVHQYSHLYDVKTARAINADKGGAYGKILIGAQFINNSGVDKTYQPILAYYNGDTLVKAEAKTPVTLSASQTNETVKAEYQIGIDTLDASVDSIKLFVWENDMITPAHEVTALVD